MQTPKVVLKGQELILDLQEKGFNLPEGFIAKVYKESVEFILTDGEGKRIFGGDVSVTAYGEDMFDADSPREVKINKGTMGAFDFTDVASVQTTLLVAEFLTDWTEFEESILNAIG